MTLATTGGGPSGGWNPPMSLYDWPNGMLNPGAQNQAIAQWRSWLLGANADAFAHVESQLTSTATLAGVTAKGLQDAQAADWKGEAADAYRKALSQLPKDLTNLEQCYSTCLSAVSSYADTTLELQAQYKAKLQELETQIGQWQQAVLASYPSEQAGMAKLHGLQGELTATARGGMMILQSFVNAWEATNGKISSLAGQAPHESTLTKLMAPIRWVKDLAVGIYDDVTNTWSSIQAFANNPSWSTLGDMSKDLGVDASIIVVAAAAPEALAGMGALDASAESSVLSVTEDVGAAAKGAGIGFGADGTAADFGQGQYGAGVISAVETGLDIDGELKTSELDQAIGDAGLLDQYQADLANASPQGALSGFTAKEQEDLKALVPNYTDPAAVSRVDAQLNQDLSTARTAAASDALKDFLKDHGIVEPASDAAGHAIDGSGSGS